MKVHISLNHKVNTDIFRWIQGLVQSSTNQRSGRNFLVDNKQSFHVNYFPEEDGWNENFLAIQLSTLMFT